MICTFWKDWYIGRNLIQVKVTKLTFSRTQAICFNCDPSKTSTRIWLMLVTILLVRELIAEWIAENQAADWTGLGARSVQVLVPSGDRRWNVVLLGLLWYIDLWSLFSNGDIVREELDEELTVDVDVPTPERTVPLIRWQSNNGMNVVSLLGTSVSMLPFRTGFMTSVEKIPGPDWLKFHPISDKIDTFLKNGITSFKYFTGRKKSKLIN